MPIYEYRCSSCGFQKEYLRKLSDPVLTDCPECGKQTFSKMLSAAGFHLKGSGWYATDFRNSGAKPAAKPDVESPTASGGKDKGDAKSDTKPDAKSDTKPDTKPDSKPAAKPDSKPDKKSESKSESKTDAVGSGAGVRQ
jgi:putative FmdB family regulatory protein